MKHLGTKKLETDRLILRQFSSRDAEAMYNNWASDPEVTKYLMWPCHKTIEVSNAILKDWTNQYCKDDTVEMVHVGYCIGKEWWNQGITSEALDVVVKLFFEEVGANRIESRHDPRNPNSGKVMTKCGLKYEGTHREADWNNQGRCDSAIYAILAKDNLTCQRKLLSETVTYL